MEASAIIDMIKIMGYVKDEQGTNRGVVLIKFKKPYKTFLNTDKYWLPFYKSTGTSIDISKKDLFFPFFGILYNEHYDSEWWIKCIKANSILSLNKTLELYKKDISEYINLKGYKFNLSIPYENDDEHQHVHNIRGSDVLNIVCKYLDDLNIDFETHPIVDEKYLALTIGDENIFGFPITITPDIMSTRNTDKYDTYLKEVYMGYYRHHWNSNHAFVLTKHMQDFLEQYYKKNGLYETKKINDRVYFVIPNEFKIFDKYVSYEKYKKSIVDSIYINFYDLLSIINRKNESQARNSLTCTCVYDFPS